MLEAVLHWLGPEEEVRHYCICGRRYRTTPRFNRLTALVKLFGFAIAMTVVVGMYVIVGPTG